MRRRRPSCRAFALAALVSAPAGCLWIAPCEGLDDDGDGACYPDDCDAADPATYPGAPEVCDGVDNDCDGVVDDACSGSATDIAAASPYVGSVVVASLLDGPGGWVLGAPSGEDADGTITGVVQVYGSDTATSPGVVLTGEVGGDELGSALAWLDAADCSGLLIGAPEAGPGGTVYIITDEVLAGEAGEFAVGEDWILRSDRSGDRLGMSMGVVHTEGGAAVLVAAPEGNNAGDVVVRTDPCSAETGLVSGVETRGGAAGTDIVGVDLDGDGFESAVFSAPFENPLPTVYVFHDLPLASSVDAADAELRGTSDAGLGRGLAGGDLTGDGYADLVVGEPGYGDDDGRVWMIAGGAEPLAAPGAIQDLAERWVDPGGAGERFGWQVLVVDDAALAVVGCATCQADLGGRGGLWWVADGLTEGGQEPDDRAFTDTNAAGFSVADLGSGVAVGGNMTAESDVLAWVFPYP